MPYKVKVSINQPLSLIILCDNIKIFHLKTRKMYINFNSFILWHHLIRCISVHVKNQFYISLSKYKKVYVSRTKNKSSSKMYLIIHLKWNTEQEMGRALMMSTMESLINDIHPKLLFLDLLPLVYSCHKVKSLLKPSNVIYEHPPNEKRELRVLESKKDWIIISVYWYSFHLKI